MKQVAIIFVLALLSINVDASASSSLSDYISKKQSNAIRLQQVSEQKVQKLRNLPKNQAYVKNITPPAAAKAENVAGLNPADFNSIETAAGVKTDKDVTAKKNSKK